MKILLHPLRIRKRHLVRTGSPQNTFSAVNEASILRDVIIGTDRIRSGETPETSGQQLSHKSPPVINSLVDNFVHSVRHDSISPQIALILR